MSPGGRDSDQKSSPVPKFLMFRGTLYEHQTTVLSWKSNLDTLRMPFTHAFLIIVEQAC